LRYLVWINQKTNNSQQTLRNLQAEMLKYQLPIEILYTDSRLDNFSESQYFEREPNFSSETYYQWCLEIIEKYHVSLFLPQRKAIYLSQFQKLFENKTLLLNVGDNQTLQICYDKGRLYRFLSKTDVPMAKFFLINTLEEFEKAYFYLLEKTEFICIKPRKDAGSRGFKLIYQNTPFDWFDAHYQISYQALAQSFSQKMQAAVLMEFLPEDEISVDCLAKDNQLVACIARVKWQDNVHERILMDENIRHYCEELINSLNLNGIFNVQFKGKSGINYFLEINTRMSGGIHYSDLSGINLLFWAIALNLNLLNAENIPQIQSDVLIVR